MGNFCNRSLHTQESTDQKADDLGNKKLQENQLVVSSNSMEMILGATEPSRPKQKVKLENETKGQGPSLILLPHQHTLFCERKQRVCTAVGRCQELEIVKVVGLESHLNKGYFIRCKNSTIPEKISTFNYTIIPQSECAKEYKLTREDVGYYIGYCVENAANSSKILRHGNSGIAFVPNLIGPVLPGPPRILDFRISGNMSVGSYANVEVQYIGGYEGASEYWWLRVDSAGKRVQVTEPKAISSPTSAKNPNTNDPRFYLITKDDAGCTLKAKCRPVRNDGTKGEIFTSKSSQVVS